MTERNKLSRFLNTAGGLTAAEAEHRADLRLELLHEIALGDLDECLNCFGAYLGLLRGNPPRVVLEELHRIANAIVATAGMFGRGSLGKAAYDLCEVIDLLETHALWDRDAVDVHYDAMRLLREGRGADEEQSLIAGLQRVKDRLGRMAT